jgi:zinc transport system substrate-binding protein
MQKAASSGKVNIVAAIFPLYDFSRAITKEQASITMLTPPGSSIHSYEPGPADIKNIQSADVFLYIGGENDAWVERILSTLDTSKMKIVRLFDFVKLSEEEEKEGMQPEEQNEEEQADEHGKLEIEYDEHIWTSPKNSALMLNAITSALCEKDSSNCENYNKNSENYISQIDELSKELSRVVNSAKRKQIVVADRFPFRYLTEEYGLDYVAAFSGCSDQSDASVATIAYLIKTVQNNKIPYIYHVELSNRNTAEAVAEQTGAKMLLLHSYHNVSKQDFENGVTYLDLLKQNVANLKIGFLEE